MRARHAAGAQHTDHLRVLVREVLHADAAVGANPHVLQVAVIDEGKQLAVLDRGQQDQAAVKAGPHTVLFLRDDALVFFFVDDVGLHADREVAGGRSSLHGAPLVVPGRIAGGNTDVDARPADRLLGGELQIRLFQRRNGVLHGEDLLDFLVVDDERHNVLTSAGSVNFYARPVKSSQFTAC